MTINITRPFLDSQFYPINVDSYLCASTPLSSCCTALWEVMKSGCVASSIFLLCQSFWLVGWVIFHLCIFIWFLEIPSCFTPRPDGDYVKCVNQCGEYSQLNSISSSDWTWIVGPSTFVSISLNYIFKFLVHMSFISSVKLFLSGLPFSAIIIELFSAFDFWIIYLHQFYHTWHLMLSWHFVFYHI